jgi:hypothetical protein
MEYQLSKVVVQASSKTEIEVVNAHMAQWTSMGWELVSANGGIGSSPSLTTSHFFYWRRDM